MVSTTSRLWNIAEDHRLAFRSDAHNRRRRGGRRACQENVMNDDALNMSTRKFLKMVGVSSQREIEHAVAEAMAANKLAGTLAMPASMTLNVPALGLSVKFDGTIHLE
jgi:hypothetical protein